MENNQPWLIAFSVLVIIVVLGGLGLYVSQNMQVNGLRQDMASAVNQLSVQINELKNQPAVDQSTAVIPAPAVSDASAATAVTPIATVSNIATFINTSGGYQFDYSKTWRVAANGKDTSINGGKFAGVGYTDYSGTPDAFLAYLQKNSIVKIISKENVIVAGKPALKVVYSGISPEGLHYLVSNLNNVVVDIYLSSGYTAADLEKFNQIVNSFKFIK